MTTPEDRPIIVGGGIAGLLTALHLAPLPVMLIVKSPLGMRCSSSWAQGGIAAGVGADDSIVQHLADTLKAGCELSSRNIAHAVVSEASAALTHLAKLGVNFCRTDDGQFQLGLEAAHSRRRIVHTIGNCGRAIMQSLIHAINTMPSIEVRDDLEVRRLVTHENVISGVIVQNSHQTDHIPCSRVVLATGGIGGLFHDSTNPPELFGQGIALAARAGAALADLEFIQFHPTALSSTQRPLPLISEALRGEGAKIRDENGTDFLARLPGQELAYRDILTRAIWHHIEEGHGVFLDAREIARGQFEKRFPDIYQICSEAGINPSCDPIPVRPAQHYHMGGVAVDKMGKTTVGGLWACGEVACTGLHGANRLASNSILEAAVCARWVAESVVETGPKHSRNTKVAAFPPSEPARVRSIVTNALGIERNANSLTTAIQTLLPLALSDDGVSDPALVALMIAVAALQRKESRGSHFRSDFPQPSQTARNSLLLLNDVLMVAESLKPKSQATMRKA